MIVGLIEEWVAAESDPDTITAINAVVLARIKQTASLSDNPCSICCTGY